MTGTGLSILDGSLPWWLPLSVAAWSFHMVVYHSVGLMFEWCDRRGWLRSFKARTAERRSYADLLPRVLFNQCCIMLPAMLLCEKAGLAYVGARHLGAARFVIDLMLMAVGHDVVQYVVHRGLLHQRRCRWLGHAIHHSTGASRAISACFMSGADFFLEIVCPYLVPLILIGGGGADLAFHLFVPSAGAIGGLYEHSGYNFGASRLLSWLPHSLVSSHAHGEHHRRSTVSFSDGFGSPGLCDTIFATRWDLASKIERS